ncbi:MAG: Peptidase S8 and S53 subtilisin kexin sedolisin, partial [Parcubacteria group bacterium Gr01-1014_66]
EVLFTWSELEPREGEYQWAELDRFLEQWNAKGKKVIPQIVLYSKKGQNPTNIHATPQWVFNAGADKITILDPVTNKWLVWPVPWDPVFLQKYRNFIQGFAQRYDGHPAIEAVDIGLGLFATTRLVLKEPAEATPKLIAKGYDPATKQPWIDTIRTVQGFYREQFKTTSLRMVITYFTHCKLVSEEFCKSITGDNEDDSVPQVSMLAKEAASQGIIVHYHDLTGTDVFLNRPWLQLYQDIHAQYPAARTSFGTDDPVVKDGVPVKKYGNIGDIVRYAFGGNIPYKGNYPESHISYLSLYADDMARSTPGSSTYDSKFADAMQYAIDRLKKPSLSKTLFLSSQTYTGNLGGLAGADAKCQALADAAELGGIGTPTKRTFKAWLSDSVTNARDRLTHATVPYQLVNGITVANNWDDLIDGQLSSPITHDELGNQIASPTLKKQVWTGTRHDGLKDLTHIESEYYCSDWSNDLSGPSGSSLFQGIFGYAGATQTTAVNVASAWSAASFTGCNQPMYLYCMEQ